MSAAEKLGCSILETLGESAVYPGHAVTLSLIIVRLYGSFAEASAPTEHGCPESLANSDVPGAGGNVYSALRLLERVVVEGVPFDDAVRMADECWATCDDQKNSTYVDRDGKDWSQHHRDRWKRGQDQADKFKEKLREALRTWR